MIPDGYETAADAAARLGVSKPTLYRLVNNGDLAAHRHPLYKRGLLFKVEEVLALRAAAPEEV